MFQTLNFVYTLDPRESVCATKLWLQQIVLTRWIMSGRLHKFFMRYKLKWLILFRWIQTSESYPVLKVKAWKYIDLGIKFFYVAAVRKKKAKCTLVHALRLCTGRTAHRGSRGIAILRLCTGRTAHRGSRGIALPFLDHGTRRGWGVSITPWPLFTPGKDPVPIVQEAGWAQGRSGQVRKILAPPGFDPQTTQPVASHYTNNATQPTIST